MYKKVKAFVSILLILMIGSLSVFASGDNQTSSDAQTFQPRVWIENLNIKLPSQNPGTNSKLVLDEFPNTVFRWTPEKITALEASGERELIPQGFTRVMNSVFLADLNGDGLPEFCATVYFGSGVGYKNVEIYDYAAGKHYELPGNLPPRDLYTLSLDDGQLIATQAELHTNKLIATGRLEIIDGALAIVSEPGRGATPAVVDNPVGEGYKIYYNGKASPSNVPLPLGSIAQFYAMLDGAPITMNIKWVISNPTYATVDPITGLVIVNKVKNVGQVALMLYDSTNKLLDTITLRII
ncbi:MAG: hypothetical protein FWH57_02875 [Oscillospiraceae bacterium]|nr:hypothetical protein [Oscillospiraceae bacterium]